MTPTPKAEIDEKHLREVSQIALGPGHWADHEFGDVVQDFARAVLALLDERRLLLEVLRAAEARCAAVLPDTREFEHERLTAAIEAAREGVRA